MILSTVSYLKYMSRGDVLQLTDISFVTKLSEITDFVDPKLFLNWKLILPFVAAALFGAFLVKLFKNEKFNVNIRVIVPILSIMLISLLFCTEASQENILPDFGLDINIRYSLEKAHESNGVVFGLYTNYLLNKVEVPAGYSKEAVFNILDNVEVSEEKMEIKPNVVVIVSESFFDPTVLSNIEFSRDPIPNIRKIISEYTSGKIISSTFAGATSNVEFEFFTGNSIAYLPYSTYPFLDMTERFETNVPTIQKDFKANGYKTIGVHTYFGDFYSRDEVYPNLGFDEFISQENIENPIYNGKYISDETFVDEIIKQLESNEGPLFVYGLSMQNHTPYTMDNFSDGSKVQIVSDNLSDIAKDKMTAYVKGLYDTDKAIQRLIDYVEKSDVPTIVLFFGDHLPSQYEAYLESDFVSTNISQDWNVEEMYKVHSIPFFIYDNFEFKDSYSHDELIGVSFLGNYLSNYIDLDKSIFFEFLDDISYTSIRDRLFVDKYGNYFSKPTKEYENEIEKFKMIQYDILYGEQYINEYLN